MGRYTLLAVSAAAAALQQGANALTLRDAASSAFNQLMTYYNQSSGFFGDNKLYYPFWTTANQLETISNYIAVVGDATGQASAALANSYVKMQPRYCNCWRDDHLWFIDAWSAAYNATGNASYLQQAQSIYAQLVGPWQSWNTTCGGVNWENGVPYRNAITNELFLSASMQLDALTKSAVPVTNFTYAGWAATEWAWLNSTVMYQPAEGIFQDGLSMTNCSAINTGGAFWTYNQGVLLDGLVRLGASTAAPQLSAFAMQVAQAATVYFSDPSDPARILREFSCSRPDGSCGGGDGTGRQFKGAFVRHLGYATALLQAQPGGAAQAAWAAQWLAGNVLSLLAHGTNVTAANQLQFGQLWQGPFQQDLSPWVSQGVGLDLLLAAAMTGALGLDEQLPVQVGGV